MIKLRIIIITAFVLLVLGLAALGQESSKPAVNVAVIRDGVKIEQVILSKGNVQVSAPQMRYDDKTKVYELIGNSTITIHQDDEHALQLVGKAGDIIRMKAEQIEDQIDAGGQIEVDHFAPIRELGKEIQTRPFFTSYRVKWYFSVFSFHSEGVAVYDRNAGTIIQYIREGDWDTGGYSYTRFSGVTDNILILMAQDVKNKNPRAGQPNITAPFDFGNLTRYGCKSEKLQ